MTPDALADIHRQCFTTPRPWRAEEFVELLDLDSVFLCHRPNGFIVGRVAGPEVELLTLAVDPGDRRKGTGKLLLMEFEKAALSRGAEDAFLEVSDANTAALALYRSFGYRESGVRKDYYLSSNGERSSAFVMTRRLVSG